MIGPSAAGGGLADRAANWPRGRRIQQINEDLPGTPRRGGLKQNEEMS